jgi:hypothetical protein
MKALTEVVYAQDSGDHSVVDPPVPIPNTEVKRYSADGSAAIGRVRVGRRQFLPTFLWKVGFFVSTQVAQSCSLRWIFLTRGYSIDDRTWILDPPAPILESPCIAPFF